MKILYPIIDGEISGGNIICLYIIEEALRRGYDVIVNSPTEGKFTRILRERGIKVHNIDTRRSFRFDSAIKLVRIIKKEGINLVHSHTPLSGTILSRIAARLSNIPVVNHEHGLVALNSHPLIKRYQLFLNVFTAKLAACRVIAVSQATMAGLIQRGIPQNIIRLVYNGVFAKNEQTVSFKSRDEVLKNLEPALSAHLIHPRPTNPAMNGGVGYGRLSIPPWAGSIIGQIGRIDKKKGQYILIQAAAQVLKNFPDVIFLIVGEDFQNGVYQKQLETLARNLGIIDHIIFTGYRPDIMELMGIFALFVLPSLAEGLPVVILEAMLAKKPVITTSAGGNAEVVIDGETGTIVPPEDPDRLAEAIIYHLQNPEASKRMGEKGYERVRRYFSLSEMLDKVMDIYKEF